MLSAADRVVLGKAIGSGFVSERDLNRSQIRLAATLASRGLLRPAGQEPDRTKVYGLTDEGRAAYGEPL